MKKPLIKNWFVLMIITLISNFQLFAQNAKPSRLYQLVQSKQKSVVNDSRVLGTTQLFHKSASAKTLEQKNTYDTILLKKTLLSIDANVQSGLYNSNAELVTIQIPVLDSAFDLVLLKHEVNPKNESDLKPVRTLSANSENGLHYRGYINGDPSSLAAFSIFDDGSVVGLFANQEGNYVVAKTKDSEDYIVYNDRDILIKPPFLCDTKDDEIISSHGNDNDGPVVLDDPAPQQCRKVRCYWEADYVTYSTNFGSNFTNAENFLKALFNQVAAMYQNEGIALELSAYKIWIEEDPYRNDNTSNALDDFRRTWNNQGNNFNGDLAFLLSGKYDGGRAYIDVLCYRTYAYGMGGLQNNSVIPIPTYSWNVNMITHEIGHNIGSNHTHWCGWNTGTDGTCGSIDNCYTQESGEGCTTCSFTWNNAAPTSSWKGTVMSYCHLVSRGIAMANGFGPLPGERVRNKVSRAVCLQKIAECPCFAPELTGTFYGINAGSSYSHAVYWYANADAVSYTFEYKKAGDASWTAVSPVTGTGYIISGLTAANTVYYYRVKANCSSSESSYSSEGTFATPCLYPATVTVSNITNSSATISWNAVAGISSYVLEYKGANDAAWTVINTSSTSYQLTDLALNTTYTYRLKANCTLSESRYNNSTFKTLNNCNTPSSVAATNILSSSASVEWAAVTGATNYTVEFKKTDDANWLVLPVTTSLNQTLSELTPATDYQYRLKATCTSINSAYATGSFSTPAVLPLILSKFEGKRKDNNSFLSWNTLQEANTSHFEIEYSADNSGYQTAGTVAAARNSTVLLQYSFIHNISNKAVVYYRLKMVDADGTCSYSKVIAIKGDNVNDADDCVLLNQMAHPVPFRDMLTIAIKSCKDQEAKLELMSMDGKTVRTELLNFRKGTASYVIRGLDKLSSGTYFLYITPSAGSIIVQKVIKQ